MCTAVVVVVSSSFSSSLTSSSGNVEGFLPIVSKTKFFSGVEDEDEDVASAPSSKSSPDEFVGFFRVASLLMMMVLFASRDRPTDDRPERKERSQEKFLTTRTGKYHKQRALFELIKNKVGYACLYKAVRVF